MADLLLIPFDGPTRRALATEAHGGKHLSDMARVVANTKLVANHLGHAWQSPYFGWHASRDCACLENHGKLICLLWTECALASDAALALERLVSTCQPLLAPTTGGLAVDTQSAGDLGWGDSLLKQAHCLEPTLLEGGLINGSLQSHANGHTRGIHSVALIRVSQ